jgi:hypothetical protein
LIRNFAEDVFRAFEAEHYGKVVIEAAIHNGMAELLSPWGAQCRTVFVDEVQVGAQA